METVAAQTTPAVEPAAAYEREHNAHLLTIADLCALISACRFAVAADDFDHADPLAAVRDWLELNQLAPTPGTPPEVAAARPYLRRGL